MAEELLLLLLLLVKCFSSENEMDTARKMEAANGTELESNVKEPVDRDRVKEDSYYVFFAVLSFWLLSFFSHSIGYGQFCTLAKLLYLGVGVFCTSSPRLSRFIYLG